MQGSPTLRAQRAIGARAFDKFTVIVEINRQEQMIFKHAISTVAIGRPHPDRGPSDGDASPAEPAESSE